MRVGDKITVISDTMTEYDEKMRVVKRKMTGMICYIHPAGRFFTVQFQSGIRESFLGRP